MKLVKLFAGPRVLKTGLAVFITAIICLKLQLPVIFACITAIVSIEPTAFDSLKKGFIRLPAAAIGAGFAFLFQLLTGQSALTFALVAMLTILVCHHMKLDNGTLVATLTAVAMIPSIGKEIIITEFLLRLSGTSLGIIIATLVNFAVLPPKFTPMLVKNVNSLYHHAANSFEQQLLYFLTARPFEVDFRNIFKELEKAFQLCEFQESEHLYRKTNEVDDRSFYYLKEKLNIVQRIIIHLVNMNKLSLSTTTFTKAEKEHLFVVSAQIKQICLSQLHECNEKLCEHELFNGLKNEINKATTFNAKISLFNEILAIIQCLKTLQKITQKEHLFSIEIQNYPAYIFSNQMQYD